MFNELQQHLYDILTCNRCPDTHSSTQLHRFKDKTAWAAGSAPSLFQQADLFNGCLRLVSLLSSQVLHVSLRKFTQLSVFTINRRFNPSFLHYWTSDSNLSLVHTIWLIAKSSIHQHSLGAGVGEKPSLNICKILWLVRILEVCWTITANQSLENRMENGENSMSNFSKY